MPSVAETINSSRRQLLEPPKCAKPLKTANFDVVNISKSTNQVEEPVATVKECAKLITLNKCGKREVIVLGLGRPVTIGRNPRECTYVIHDRIVSNIHCKFDVVLSSTGGALVSCQDMSTNGIFINGHRLHKSAAIIMDGDEIEVPGHTSTLFSCVHSLKGSCERVSIFEPTPPQGCYKTVKIGCYDVMSHCLGSGSFASVHLSFDSLSFKQVACKTIVARPRKGDLQKVMSEVNILRGLRHPNINGILDVVVNENAGWVHIFLELCTGGDLFSYISRHKLGEAEAKFISYQLFKGVEYLHNRSVSHRDLKPENILIHSPGPFPRIQIADFGLARARAYQETLNVCGTVSYLPPEGILALDNKELGYVGMPADCWSAGVIIYIMLTGTHPFDYCEANSNYSQNSWNDSSQVSIASEEIIKTRIIRGSVDYFDIWNSIPEAKILVEGLLVREPSKRLTVQAALEARWIVINSKELLHDYNERIKNF
ncbi:kinase [Pyrrhoderma noxium]|uniref:Kinase n=1 Tax=Pyrrhoderma noxium TaxID=2282107 RepID=A0A286URD2_9AGAM|nr:kinase [Pyrrhoderma noxium]